jgi:hypothetical protein
VLGKAVVTHVSPIAASHTPATLKTKGKPNANKAKAFFSSNAKASKASKVHKVQTRKKKGMFSNMLAPRNYLTTIGVVFVGAQVVVLVGVIITSRVRREIEDEVMAEYNTERRSVSGICATGVCAASVLCNVQQALHISRDMYAASSKLYINCI